jgi:small-conductance mechanosensitive channel
MLNEDQATGVQGPEPGAKGPSDRETEDAAQASPAPSREESLVEEIGALIDDAQLYATAELAFQRTRAKLAGKNVGAALLFIVVAVILLHIALIAMAVGMVLALEPLMTIWGAIAIVVGLMLVGVVVLVSLAASRGRLVSEMFAVEEIASEESDGAEGKPENGETDTDVAAQETGS